jgi:flavin reductase ActVB
MTVPLSPRADVEALFKESMAALASGVAVVTGAAPDGSPRGLTVTSIASYSAHPPSVIVCVDESCNSYAALTTGSHFAAHLLPAEQADVAKLFASSATDKFDQVSWTPWDDGLPILSDVLAVVICHRMSTTVHGDHAILVGEVVDGSMRQAQPLVYWRRGFYEGPGHPTGGG